MSDQKVEQNDKAAESTRPTGYTTDHTGKPSMMRAMSAVALATSIVFGLIILIRPVLGEGGTADYGFNGIYLTTVFLVAAFAPKAVQKFAEAHFPAPGSR